MATQATLSEISPTGNSGNHPNSRANLRPFRPGQSGNPAGRPKKLLTDEYTRLMRDKKKRKAVANALVAGAAAGKIEHIRELTDRVDGPIEKQTTSTTIQVNAMFVPSDWAEKHKSMQVPQLAEEVNKEEE